MLNAVFAIGAHLAVVYAQPRADLVQDAVCVRQRAARVGADADEAASGRLGMVERVEADDAENIGFRDAQGMRNALDLRGADAAMRGLHIPENGQQRLPPAPDIARANGVDG